MTPEHFHLVLNHLPIVGLAMAVLPLLAGLIARNRAWQLCGLMLVLLSALSVPLVVWSGEQAHDRYDEGVVAPFIDADGKHWMHVHGSRAERGVKVYYAEAALAALSLVTAWKKPPWASLASALTLAVAIGALGVGVWIADAGGKIRRPDFRGPAATVPTSEPASSEGVSGHRH